MDNTMQLTISTPTRHFYTGQTEMVIVTSTTGQMGILPSHMPVVVALKTAPVKFKVKGKWLIASLTGGFAQIDGENVVILANTAEWPEDIEVNRALEAKKRAEERLAASQSVIEYYRTLAALQRALTRLEVKGYNKR